MRVKDILRRSLGLILRGGRDSLLLILFIIISMVSLTGILVNKFSTSSGVFSYCCYI